LPLEKEGIAMMGLLWSLLGILSGTFIALQAPINAALARDLGLSVAAAAASFLAGSVVLVAISLVAGPAQGVSLAWRAPPLWMFVAGGLLGAVYVTSVIVLTPKLGTAATMAFIVAGQMLAGLVLDHMGLFGFLERAITPGRMAGAVLLVLGALLMRVY
jgi:bacterial/archaeal transporter family-2 protein